MVVESSSITLVIKRRETEDTGQGSIEGTMPIKRGNKGREVLPSVNNILRYR